MSAAQGRERRARGWRCWLGHGKFLVAEPFFGAGPRPVVSRDRDVAVGDLVVVRAGSRRNGRGGGRATVVRRIGRPDVARDVIEALMVDRGPARAGSIRRSSTRRARYPRPRSRPRTAPSGPLIAAICARCRHSRSTRQPRATSTTRSRPRSRTTARGVYGCTSPTCRRTSGRARCSTARPTGAGPASTSPARSSRCFPRRFPARACSLVPGQDRLAVTVELVLDGARVRSSAFYRSVIRSDERLDYGQRRPHLRRPRASVGRWGAALEVARAAAAALEERRASQAALVARVLRARVRVRQTRERRRRPSRSRRPSRIG